MMPVDKCNTSFGGCLILCVCPSQYILRNLPSKGILHVQTILNIEDFDVRTIQCKFMVKRATCKYDELASNSFIGHFILHLATKAQSLSLSVLSVAW